MVAFFLPWVSLGPIDFTGYDIPNVANMMSSLQETTTNYTLYLVYLVQLVGDSFGYLIEFPRHLLDFSAV